MSAPTPLTLRRVQDRDDNRCARCGDKVGGTRGIDWSLHHRCPRAAGGTSRAWVNLPSNLILLHGSGTTGCHGQVESRRIWASDAGFLVSSNGRAVASAVALKHAVHGLVYLYDDGGFELVRPSREAGE